MTSGRSLAISVAVAVAGAALVPGAARAAPPGAVTPEIIGGTTTKVGQYPSVVVLVIGNNLCTGTLIAPSWVLTAGHCVDPDVLGLASQDRVTASTDVHFDTVDVMSDNGVVVGAAATFKDPAFDKAHLGSHDIGLIQLATPVTRIAPSPINLDAAAAPIGTVVTIVGYGTTEQGGGGLRGVEFALPNRVAVPCSSVGVSASDANLLCFSQADHRGTCQGDSGGPAFAMIRGRSTVVGVTSFGDPDCADYGADTRVDAELAYLATVVPELIGCLQDSDCPSHRICFSHTCLAEPFSATGIGSVCSTGTDCDTAICAESSQDGKRCSVACDPTTGGRCPDGFTCLKASDSAGACWPEAAGCCQVGGDPQAALAGAAAVALGLRRRRQPRRSNTQSSPSVS